MLTFKPLGELATLAAIFGATVTTTLAATANARAAKTTGPKALRSKTGAKPTQRTEASQGTKPAAFLGLCCPRFKRIIPHAFPGSLLPLLTVGFKVGQILVHADDQPIQVVTQVRAFLLGQYLKNIVALGFPLPQLPGEGPPGIGERNQLHAAVTRIRLPHNMPGVL